MHDSHDRPTGTVRGPRATLAAAMARAATDRRSDAPAAAARAGRLLALGAAACFGANGTISKLVLQSGLPADRLTQLRATGGALVLLLIVAATRPAALHIRRNEVGVILLSGFIGVALVQWLYFVAIQRLPVGVALLVQFTAPVLVALWSRFGLPIAGRRAVHPRVWLALGFVVVGLGVLAQVWHGLTLDPIGLAAAAASSAALASFYTLAAHAVGRRDGSSFAALVLLVGAVIWSVIKPWWTFPVAVLGGSSAIGDVPVWLLCIGVVVIGTVAPYLLTFASLKRLGATDASVVATVEPLLAGLVAWAVLSEVLTPVQLLGGAVVLTGIILAQTAPPATSGAAA